MKHNFRATEGAPEAEGMAGLVTKQGTTAPLRQQAAMWVISVDVPSEGRRVVDLIEGRRQAMPWKTAEWYGIEQEFSKTPPEFGSRR